MSATIALFTSVKTTITLLFLLAGTSIIGTLIPQGQTLEQLRQTTSPFAYRLIVILDLNDVYSSWWFLTLLTLLAMNLLACLLQRTPHILSQWRDSDRRASFILRFSDSRPVDAVQPAITDAIRSVLGGTPLETRSSDGVTLSWVKHRFQLLGFPFIHVAIVIILAGGLLGLLFGFRGHVLIREGEAANEFVLTPSRQVMSLPFQIAVDSFTLTRYPSGQPKEFRSDVRIIDDGKEVLEGSILVNHPLSYRGLAFYQSDYRIVDIKSVEFLLIRPDGTDQPLSIEPEETFRIPDEKIEVSLLRLDPGRGERGPGIEISVTRPNQAAQPVRLYRNDPEPYRLNSWGLRFREFTPLYATGLQIGYDPGTVVVWVGCAMLILGFGVALFTNLRRVHVELTSEDGGTRVKVSGNCKRQRKEFRTEVENAVTDALQRQA